MSASRTPRLDAVKAWLDGGDWSAPLVWPADPTPDWPRPWTRLERLRCIVSSCSSGAAAARVRLVDRRGRPIPDPPRRNP
jgi:hypothetical protein